MNDNSIKLEWVPSGYKQQVTKAVNIDRIKYNTNPTLYNRKDVAVKYRAKQTDINSSY